MATDAPTAVFLKTSVACGSTWLVAKQWLKKDPMFTRKEAAAWWITCGICEFLVGQVFLKRQLKTMSAEDPKRFEVDSIIKLATVTAFIYGGVGYFGYIKGYGKAPYYVGMGAASLTFGFSLLTLSKGEKLMASFPLVKSIGMAMTLFHCSLVSADS